MNLQQHILLSTFTWMALLDFFGDILKVHLEMNSEILPTGHAWLF